MTCHCRKNVDRAECAISRGGLATCMCACHGRDPAEDDEATLARYERDRTRRLSGVERDLALRSLYGSRVANDCAAAARMRRAAK